MATANSINVLRVANRLCSTPTDLTTAFPHGGTALGLTAKVTIQPRPIVSVITAEEFGGIPIDGIYCGEQVLITCLLRGWDADALSAVFPNTTAGTVSGKRYLRFEPGVSGQNKPGYRLSNKVVKLFFSPENTNYHPGLLVYNAMPAFQESAELALQHDSELALAVAFWALPDTNGRAYEIGYAKDLNIT